MSASFLPPPKEVLSIVEEELAGIGGRISDSFRHRGRLFLRATVPHTQQVRPNDHIQGGVAVTTVGREIGIHPYVFRQGCRSGAIMSKTLGHRRIRRTDVDATTQTLGRLRKKLRARVQESASADTLHLITSQLRAASMSKVDVALQMSTVISRIPRRHSSLLLSQILSEFHDDDDSSVYALMNAVAAVARDEDDPETKWDLEELAGSVPALVPTDPELLETASQFVAVG
jgi:hypothetical protein